MNTTRRFMKAKITKANVKGYLQAHYRKALNELDFLDQHIQEQAEWRLKQVEKKSPDCFKADKCTHCGCEVSSKVFEDRPCEGGCYPKMMDEYEWSYFDEDVYNYEGVSGDTYEYGHPNHMSISPMIIFDMGNPNQTLADLMQDNPHLTREELLKWCPKLKNYG